MNHFWFGNLLTIFENNQVGEIATSSLPLLQLVLSTLWTRKDTGWITLENYTKHKKDTALTLLGEIIQRHADSVYNSLLENEKDAFRSLFSQLVSLRHYRSRKSYESRLIPLKLLNPDYSDRELIRKLISSGLLKIVRTEDDDYISFSHDGLTSNWQLPAITVADESQQAFYLWKDDLRNRLNYWDLNLRGENYLLRGVPMREAETYLETHHDYLTQLELEYIDNSKIKIKNLRNQYRLKALLSCIVVLSMAALGWLIFDLKTKRNETLAVGEAIGMNALSSAEQIRKGHYKIAAKSSLQLFHRLKNLDVDAGHSVSLSLLKDMRRSITFIDSESDQQTLKFDSDITKTALITHSEKPTIAASVGDNRFLIAEIDVFSGSGMFNIVHDIELKGIGQVGKRCSFSMPKEKRWRGRINLINRTENATVLTDDLGNLSVTYYDGVKYDTKQSLCVHEGNIYDIDLSKNGDFIATGSEDNFAKIITLNASYNSVIVHDGKDFQAPVYSVNFISNSELIVRTADSKVFYWDFKRNKSFKFDDREEIVVSVEVFGRNVLIAYNDGVIDVSQIQANPIEEMMSPDLELNNDGEELVGAGFIRSGSLIYSRTRQGNVRVWDTKKDLIPRVYNYGNTPITSVATSQDGMHILSTTAGYLGAPSSIHYTSLVDDITVSADDSTINFRSAVNQNIQNSSLFGNSLALTGSQRLGDSGDMLVWDLNEYKDPYLVLPQIFYAELVNGDWLLIQKRNSFRVLNLERNTTKEAIVSKICTLLNSTESYCPRGE